MCTHSPRVRLCSISGWPAIIGQKKTPVAGRRAGDAIARVVRYIVLWTRPESKELRETTSGYLDLGLDKVRQSQRANCHKQSSRRMDVAWYAPLDWSRGLFQGSLGGKENHEGSPKHQHEFCQCAMKASQRKMPGCSRGAKGRRSFQSLQFHAGPPLGLAGGVLPLVQGMMDNATISSCGRVRRGNRQNRRSRKRLCPSANADPAQVLHCLRQFGTSLVAKFVVALEFLQGMHRIPPSFC